MVRRRRAQRIVSSDDESQPSPSPDRSNSSSEEEEGQSDEERHDLIDLEAAEEEEAEDTLEHSDDSESDDGPSCSTFHHFASLPPELRDRIWEFFCPELIDHTRILRLGLELDYDEDECEATGHFWDGPYLESMTATFRCLSSIHRESRQRALKFAPDEIRLGGNSYDAVVRINGARDILCLNYVHYSPRIEHTSQWQPKCGGPVQRIAIRSDEFQGMKNFGGLKAFQSLFPELKVLYNLTEEISLNDRWLRWCVSDYALKFYHERVEDVGPIPEILPMLLCLPDAERYPDFAKYSLGGLAQNHCDQTILDEIEQSGVALRPMVSFPYAAGAERFEELEQSKNLPLPELPPDWPSDAEEEAMAAANEDEEDEYESDGIDDDEIGEDVLSSEDEFVPRPISPASDAQTPLSITSSPGNEAAAANFSSVEPSDPEESTDGVNPSKRKRRIISDSDDEDDKGVAEEHSATNQRKRRRTARTLQSDSETEPGEDKPPARPDDRNGSESEEEPSSSSSSSSSDESARAPKKPLSLAQRLRQQQRPVGRHQRANESDMEDDNEDDMLSPEDDDEEDEKPRRRGGAFFLDEASEDDSDDGEEDESDLD